MIRRLLAITFLLALPIAGVFAQQKPDFSGTWKLNLAKSFLGELGGPNSRTDVIIHKAQTLSVSTVAASLHGKEEYKLDYTTDGKESINILSPYQVKSIVKWVGGNLVISSRFVYRNLNITSEATWTLSPDGKTLTIKTNVKGDLGNHTQRFVLEKQ
jgi:hypothetical protein